MPKFCDLIGSTALSARLDPEDLREIIGAYQRAVTEIVAGFDGFVAKYMGDGVLVYFGYPRAHEDDAERAVRAGLGVIDVVGRLDVKSVKFQARVGIATGLVVVGDLIGEGSAQEQSVVGETPKLAARLQALAGSDHTVISESTRRLIGSLFEYESLGEIEVKVLPAPVRAFRVLGESRVGSRFEALRSGESPLIGRDEELELLQRRWEQAKVGNGRVVLISAEPGIGKSRLAEAFRESLGGVPHNHCGISVHLITRTAPSTRLLGSSNEPAALSATIRPWRGSTSWRRWLPRTHGPMMCHCWPRCCRCRSTAATLRSI
jgi:class 3 adenylate cyclase